MLQFFKTIVYIDEKIIFDFVVKNQPQVKGKVSPMSHNQWSFLYWNSIYRNVLSDTAKRQTFGGIAQKMEQLPQLDACRNSKI